MRLAAVRSFSMVFVNDNACNNLNRMPQQDTRAGRKRSSQSVWCALAFKPSSCVTVNAIVPADLSFSTPVTERR